MFASLLHDLNFRLRAFRARRSRPVVTWVDAQYGPAVLVMLNSLYSNNLNTPFDTLIFTPPGERGVAQARFDFAALGARFGRHIGVHEIDDARLHGLPLSGVLPYLSHATYGNLLLSGLVAAGSFLYLDSDLVVQEDIAPLLALPLGQALIAAVADWGDASEWGTRLGLDNADTYVNNGVMVVNAAAWRRENLLQRIFDWQQRLGERASFLDQDLLNVATIGRKKLLDAKWNVMQHALLKQGRLPMVDAASFRGIFHFTGLPKPWTPHGPSQPRALYERYAWLSPPQM